MSQVHPKMLKNQDSYLKRRVPPVVILRSVQILFQTLSQKLTDPERTRITCCGLTSYLRGAGGAHLYHEIRCPVDCLQARKIASEKPGKRDEGIAEIDLSFESHVLANTELQTPRRLPANGRHDLVAEARRKYGPLFFPIIDK